VGEREGERGREREREGEREREREREGERDGERGREEYGVDVDTEVDSTTFQSVGSALLLASLPHLTSLPFLHAPMSGEREREREREREKERERDGESDGRVAEEREREREAAVEKRELNSLSLLLSRAARLWRADAVVSGAVDSNSQRISFEAAAASAGLLSLAPLWRWEAQRVLWTSLSLSLSRFFEGCWCWSPCSVAW
jgi:diphthamide synthase (EF-2-diphthine--ammonia ligase)